MAIFNTVYGGEPKWKPNANTIAYLKLETNANDSSWNGNNGTASNITYTTLSTWKKVATFNGSSSKIDFSSSLFTSYPFTCNIWVYGDGLDTSTWLNEIIWNGKSDTQGFLADHYGSKIRAFVNVAEASGTGYYVNNSWFLFTAIYDGTSLQCYKNLNLVGSASPTALTSSNVRNFFIWYRAFNNDRYWKWYMSEFICESKVWWLTELNTYYNQTKANYS